MKFLKNTIGAVLLIGTSLLSLPLTADEILADGTANANFTENENFQSNEGFESEPMGTDRNILGMDSWSSSSCCCTDECLPHQLWIRHTEGKGLGYSDGYTTVGLFLTHAPCCMPNFLTFVDLRDHTFNSGRVAATAGAGFRYLSPSWGKVIGANVYYDYYNKHHDFNQVGCGLELLSECYDLRINGYFPVGARRETYHKCCFLYPGGFKASLRHREESLTGFDSEIGKNINNFLCFPGKSLYAAVGPYYYGNRDHHFWGGRIRLAYQYNRYLGLEVRSTYDRYFKGTVQGVVTLTIPFGKCGEESCCNTCFCDYLQPVYRNDIVVTDKEKCCWRFNW